MVRYTSQEGYKTFMVQPAASSLFETIVQPVESQSKKQVIEAQHAEESMVTVDAIKSLEASRLVEELRN
ncbi:hypothetical protein Tco_0767559 [Tanacetum coccineum]